MTFQDLFSQITEYRALVLGIMFLAPWISYLICIIIPGTKEEPFILNLNLALALICLGGEFAYLAYTSHIGGIQKIVNESEFLFLLAPIYYVGVSLWVSRQRLPLKQLPVYRAIQGLAMIMAAYLLLSWLMGKMRIVLLSYLPFGMLILGILLLLSLGYLGYLKILGKENPNSVNTDIKSIDRELARLKKQKRKKF